MTSHRFSFTKKSQGMVSERGCPAPLMYPAGEAVAHAERGYPGPARRGLRVCARRPWGSAVHQSGWPPPKTSLVASAPVPTQFSRTRALVDLESALVLYRVCDAQCAGYTTILHECKYTVNLQWLLCCAQKDGLGKAKIECFVFSFFLGTL